MKKVTIFQDEVKVWHFISEEIAPADQKNKRSKFYQFDTYLTLLQEEY